MPPRLIPALEGPRASGLSGAVSVAPAAISQRLPRGQCRSGELRHPPHRTTGRLWILLASLAVTPVRRLSPKLGWLVRFRRLIGLYAFFYGTLHLATYIFLFSGYDLPGALAGVKAGHPRSHRRSVEGRLADHARRPAQAPLHPGRPACVADSASCSPCHQPKVPVDGARRQELAADPPPGVCRRESPGWSTLSGW
jgi:hypothetical protein